MFKKLVLRPDLKVGHDALEPFTFLFRDLREVAFNIDPEVHVNDVRIRPVSSTVGHAERLGLPDKIDLTLIQPTNSCKFPCSDAIKILLSSPVNCSIVVSLFTTVLQKYISVLHRMIYTKPFDRCLFTTFDSAFDVTRSSTHVDRKGCEFTEIDVSKKTRMTHTDIRTNDLYVRSVYRPDPFADLIDRQALTFTSATFDAKRMSNSIENVAEVVLKFAKFNIDKCARFRSVRPRLWLDFDDVTVFIEQTLFGLNETYSFQRSEPFGMTSTAADCIDEGVPPTKFTIDERCAPFKADVRTFIDIDKITVCRPKSVTNQTDVHFDMVSNDVHCNPISPLQKVQ